MAAPEVASASTGFMRVNGSAADVPRPSGTTNGDFLLAIHMSDTDGTLANTVPPSGWTSHDAGARVVPAVNMKIAYKIADNEPASWTFPGTSGAYRFVIVLRLTGVDTTAPFSANAVYSTTTTGTTSHTAPSVTPAVADSLHVCVWAKYDYTGRGSHSTTQPAGYTQHARIASGSTNQSMAATAAVGATATGTQTNTNSTSTQYLAVSLALAPAPAATGDGGAFLPFFGKV